MCSEDKYIDSDEKINYAKYSFILLRRTSQKLLPGGGVNSGEPPKAAICRELEKEVGLKVNTEDVTLFSIYSHQIERANDYPILYIVKKFEIISNAKKSSEIKQVGWFSLHELPLNTPIYTQQRIKEYLGELPVNEKW